MESIPRTSGIYQITCTPTGKIYIGSAIDLHLRRQQHLADLRASRHVNRHLQNAWNKHGEAAFVFSVIELVLSSFLLEREQYWLDKRKSYDQKKGFNISPTAGSSIGIKRSAETREKVRASKLGQPRPYSDQARLSRSLSQKGKAPSENTRLAQIEAESHCYVVTDPDGNTYPIKNLSKFCREHGLDKRTAHGIIRGKGKSYKGWVFRRPEGLS